MVLSSEPQSLGKRFRRHLRLVPKRQVDLRSLSSRVESSRARGVGHEQECGYDVYYSSAATSAFYPFGGYLHDNSGQEVFVQPYLWGGVWTCTASNRRGGSTFEPAAGKCVILIQGTANPDYRAESQTLGYAVRCIEE